MGARGNLRVILWKESLVPSIISKQTALMLDRKARNRLFDALDGAKFCFHNGERLTLAENAHGDPNSPGNHDQSNDSQADLQKIKNLFAHGMSDPQHEW